MDLSRQPPRRPSNVSIAGIVNLARMTDKARAYNRRTLGEFLYGDDSGLDKILLEFLDVSHDDFADAAGRYGDSDLARWIREVSDRTDEEIDAFNRYHLQREPDDDAGKQRLKDRIEKFAPGRTDIVTVFQSIELDDWANFKDVDLSQRAPRSPYRRDVAEIFGLARMADKARAERAGTLGEYIYNCPIDQAITDFVGFTAEDFKEAAYQNPNDLELGDWVRENTRAHSGEISQFNHRISNKGPENIKECAVFKMALANAAPKRTDITTWFDLLDVDDEVSFGVVDLTRHPPRSPYDDSVGGLFGLARMIDKGRAAIHQLLGQYKYAEDSGLDKKIAEFFGFSVGDFTDLIRAGRTDEEIVAWLNKNHGKSGSEISEFNHDIGTIEPWNEKRRAWFRGVLAGLDESRTDVTTYMALIVLDDTIHFARLKTAI